MTRDSIVATLQRLEPALRELGVVRATLFGSRARNEGAAESDIDIAVSPRLGQALGPQDLLSIYGLLGDAFGHHVSIDVVILPARDPDLNAAIARDSILAFS